MITCPTGRRSTLPSQMWEDHSEGCLAGAFNLTYGRNHTRPHFFKKNNLSPTGGSARPSSVRRCGGLRGIPGGIHGGDRSVCGPLLLLLRWWGKRLLITEADESDVALHGASGRVSGDPGWRWYSVSMYMEFQVAVHRRWYWEYRVAVLRHWYWECYRGAVHGHVLGVVRGISMGTHTTGRTRGGAYSAAIGAQECEESRA